MITAIETKYDHHHFRSRLEARWAVFFNHADIPYRYELQGYKDTNKGTCYLPDFYLPTMNTWLEVKPFAASDAARDKAEMATYSEEASMCIIVEGDPYYPSARVFSRRDIFDIRDGHADVYNVNAEHGSFVTEHECLLTWGMLSVWIKYAHNRAFGEDIQNAHTKSAELLMKKAKLEWRLAQIYGWESERGAAYRESSELSGTLAENYLSYVAVARSFPMPTKEDDRMYVLQFPSVNIARQHTTSEIEHAMITARQWRF